MRSIPFKGDHITSHDPALNAGSIIKYVPPCGGGMEIFMEKAKKFFYPGLFIAAGLFNFIWIALNHMSAFLSYSGESENEPLFNGFKFIGEEVDGADGEFFKVLASIMLVLLIVLSVVMLAYGVIKLLKALGITFIPESFNKYVDFIGALSIILNFAFAIAEFAFVGLFSICNIESAFGVLIGVRPGIGCWLLLIWGIAAFVGSNIIIKKVGFDCLVDGADSAKFICTQCGAEAKSGEKFCTSCGGTVVAISAKPVCSKCGKTAKKDEKFCSACGGAVEVTAIKYFCTACNKEAKKDDKFCTSCGGTVVAKDLLKELGSK